MKAALFLALAFMTAPAARAGGLGGFLKDLCKDIGLCHGGGDHHDNGKGQGQGNGSGGGAGTTPGNLPPPPPPAPAPAPPPAPAPAPAPAPTPSPTPSPQAKPAPPAPQPQPPATPDSPKAAAESPKPPAKATGGGLPVPTYPGYADPSATLAYARQMLSAAPQTPDVIAALKALDQAEAMMKANPMDPNAMTALAKGMAVAQAPDSARAPASVAPAPPKAESPDSDLPRIAPVTRAPAVRPGGALLTSGSESEGGGFAALNPRQILLDTSQSLEQNPDDFNARASRAEALNALGDYQAAEDEADKALKLSPRLLKALNARAFAYNKRGQYSLALADAEAALAEDPNNAMAHLNKAMALEGLGHLREALKEYEGAAGIDSALKTFFRDAVGRFGQTVGYHAAGDEAPQSAPAKPDQGPGLWEYGLLIMGIGVPVALWAALKRPREKAGEKTSDGLLNGTYRIEKQIGEGGMGLVFEGFDTSLQRKVAIKKMRGDVRLNEQFLQEARLVAALKHPNLVEIYAVFEENKEIYQVFEYLAGKPLDGILEAKKRLPAAEVLHILGQVASGLDYAHEKRIIHRDLKPANIMLTNEGAAKLMDFGIAHQARATSSAKFTRAEAWGTSWYMAPEQELGTVSVESDLYALGVMTYELLTGAPPFPGPDFRMQKAAMAFKPASLLVPELSGFVDSVLTRALAPLPDARYHSASEFVAALGEALQKKAAVV